MVCPDALEVLTWRQGAAEPEFLPVDSVTRRLFEGEIVAVKTKMGRRVQTTPDHPFVVAEHPGGPARVELAEDLTSEDWLPVVAKRAITGFACAPRSCHGRWGRCRRPHRE